MDADLAQVLALILERLDHLAGTGRSPAAQPDGFVAVSPTGVHGAGKVRFWPETKPDASGRPEQYFGYVNRMQRTLNSAGKPYWPVGQWGDALLGGADPADNNQVRADKHTYPSDWWSQIEIDRQAAVAAAQGTPVWTSNPGPSDVPIAQ